MHSTINKLIKNNCIYFDGAFGTYYSTVYGEDNCEWANINSSGKVKRIHNSYAKAGANLLRSNTYMANAYNPSMNEQTSESIIREGYKIVREVAKKYDNCYPCADIGPISFDVEDRHGLDKSDILKEYKRIIDLFVLSGAEIFVFETMADTSPVDEAISYLREIKSTAYIFCQFAIRPDGYTRSSKSIETIIKTANKMDCDAIGLNCASGPIHMISHIKKVIKLTHKPISALPNAGFPTLFEGRQVYSAANDYFGKMVSEMIALGVKFPGGCCGSDPTYIQSIIKHRHDMPKRTEKKHTQKAKVIYNKIDMPKVDIFVELTPPHNGNPKPLLNRAKELQNMGITTLTLPDSPLGRSRMNPLILSSMIRAKTKVDTLAHLCCRDRNITAIQSDLMGAWAFGLRNVLCVTGDPVLAGSRDEIKSVFNFSAIGLLELISQMNEELFLTSPIKLYAGINLGVRKFDAEIRRCQKKEKAGASTFLTQPIYLDEQIERIRKFKRFTNSKIMVGIMPPVTYRNAMFLHNEVPGITIPKSMIDALNGNYGREESEDISTKLMAQVATKALEYADGLYILPPFSRTSLVAKVLNYMNPSSGRISDITTNSDSKMRSTDFI